MMSFQQYVFAVEKHVSSRQVVNQQEKEKTTKHTSDPRDNRKLTSTLILHK